LRRAAAPILAALLLAATASGCGGSNRDRAQDAAESYVEALQDGDAEGACELLSRGAVEELEDRAGAGCVAAMDDLFAALEEEGGSLTDVRVDEVNVAGRVATATFTGALGKTTTELTREGDDWKLTSAPGG
jgi:hypothetical protein